MRGPLRAAWAAGAALSVALISGAALSESGGQAAKPPAPDPALTVIASGELNGNLTPCGCSKPMLGGLPRRAAFLARLPAGSPQVKVENGDLTEALGRQDEMKAETAVEMLERMKYDAISLGEKDFRLGAPFLQSLQDRFKGSLLCANARNEKDEAVFRESVVVNRDVAGRPVRVGITGVLSDQHNDLVKAINPDIHLESAEAALDRIVPQLAAKADVLILLYHGPKSDGESLARRYPQFQLILCAHEGDSTAAVTRVGSGAVVTAGEDGKRMATIRLTPGTWQAAAKEEALSPDYADDAGIMQIKLSYLQRVTAEDLLGKTPRLPTANGAAFVGTAACGACHATAMSAWKASGHAHALPTLAKEHEDKDPECVQCHVVGLDRQTGFTTHEKTPALENVGCESCHGPGSRHAADAKVSLGKAGKAACETCHVTQHSPQFDFAKYWPRIKHGL